MVLHVVQPNENIYDIADRYGISVAKLIDDNGISNPYHLVPGQVILIAYPLKTHIVTDGETLVSIANTYGITVMQLLRNNPFLYDRQYIFPGETLVISYDTQRELSTNGYAYSFINIDILKRTLPYLSFISVFNYTILSKGEIVSYGNDADIIQLSKAYGVVPLLMISTLTPTGEPNIEVDYELLLNEEYQNQLIERLRNILNDSGYLGINILINNLNTTNQKLYIDLLNKISSRIKERGYFLFITVNPHIKTDDNTVTYERVDYASISSLVYRLTILQYTWGVNKEAPAPISSISSIRSFLEYYSSIAPTDNVSIGIPLIAYDWVLPYNPRDRFATSLSLNAAISLAREHGVEIYFDETSKTPYFNYYQSLTGEIEYHIVWFVDGRTLNALDDLIIEFEIIGSGLWNIMVYYQQMWSILNTRFSIIKFLPDSII
jgi:spore germination protein